MTFKQDRIGIVFLCFRYVRDYLEPWSMLARAAAMIAAILSHAPFAAYVIGDYTDLDGHAGQEQFSHRVDSSLCSDSFIFSRIYPGQRISDIDRYHSGRCFIMW